MILCYPAISNSFLLVCRAGACPSSEFSLCSISWHWSLLLVTELLIHSYLSEGLKNMVSKSSHNMNSEGLGEASWCFEMLCRARPDQGSPENKVWRWYPISGQLTTWSFPLTNFLWSEPEIILGIAKAKLSQLSQAMTFPHAVPSLLVLLKGTQGSKILLTACLASPP